MDQFRQLTRGWMQMNAHGPLAEAVPDWFLQALRKAAARTPEGRARPRARARE